jgi:oligopeptide/dipeptide ABC transporter ATP-binding protein
MYRGTIVEVGSTEQMTERPNHPYTRSLLEATPEVMA